MNRNKTFGLILAAASFTCGFWETTGQETLKVQYHDHRGRPLTLPVEKDVNVLSFDSTIGQISLPE